MLCTFSELYYMWFRRT
uniref:Uncharacterized protein n=1 Tax=Anguilla anguilla TaxID=7936 RepID=A0A0E9UYI5_ANGAN